MIRAESIFRLKNASQWWKSYDERIQLYLILVYLCLSSSLSLSFLSYTQASKYSRLLANGQNSLYWRSVMHRKYPVKMCLDSTSIIYSYCFREILVFFVYISTKFLYFISIINIYIFYISLSYTLAIYSLQNIEFFFFHFIIIFIYLYYNILCSNFPTSPDLKRGHDTITVIIIIKIF